MNATQLSRKERLLPNGIPRYIRIYDNGGETFDRYTAVFTGRYKKNDGLCFCRGMSTDPFEPQGFGISFEMPVGFDCNSHGFSVPVGRKNRFGKRINFSDLPPACQRSVLQDYCDIWELTF